MRRNIKRANWYLLGIFAIAVVSGILVGYGTAVIAGALPLIQAQLSLDAWHQGLLVAIVLIGGFIGSLLCGPIINVSGHKKTFLLVAIIFIVGCLWSAWVDTFWPLFYARLLTGLAIGMATVVGPMYVAETSPQDLRGFLVGSVQLAITIGILLAYLSNYYFAATSNWPSMFAIGVFPAFALLIIIYLQPESPRWLLLKNRVEEAKTVFRELHGIAWGIAESTTVNPEIPTSMKALINPLILPVVLFASGLFFFQNLSGIDAILYYAPAIFQQSGFRSLQGSLQIAILLGIINIVATLLSMWLLDHVGRRPILVYGLLLMSLSLVGFSLLQHYVVIYPAIKWLLAFMLLVFVASFALSMGPIPYVLMSELFPTQLRTSGMAIASATAWGVNALVTFAYPLVVETIGISRLFLGFAFVCMLAWIISIIFCPETKNQSLEDIEARLQAGVGIRQLGG
ncbi:sugar porter family MFS transporter [Legionella cardiaca]|uniref:Sugar porter family MFS transporter n=1 Tax=Legionella cardiaca TaxID=1071983 RepID=A0ABY8ANG0_9GAMM|nr:sugar porter family MFS transporter [Legionella cardiaca]WED42180.1 sugar porter family MFS transporter [Legionella cardiaca]